MIDTSHAALLREVHYNPETGQFTRLLKTSNRARLGPFGSIDSLGYVVMSVLGRCTRAHRLAVFYMTGSWPIGEVDHIAQGKRAP